MWFNKPPLGVSSGYSGVAGVFIFDKFHGAHFIILFIRGS